MSDAKRYRHEPAFMVICSDGDYVLESKYSYLKAEVAGLKTGYQAYERVNAELKAEVDSLTREADRQYTTIETYRHDAERYQWLRSGASVILNKEVGFTAESGARIYSTMPTQRELDSAIDAAMRWGECP